MIPKRNNTSARHADKGTGIEPSKDSQLVECAPARIHVRLGRDSLNPSVSCSANNREEGRANRVRWQARPVSHITL